MSSSDWQVGKLRDLCTKIGSGATPRGGKESYLDKGPFALVRSQNVLDFFFSFGGLAFIDEDQANQLSNVELQERDVLLNITGDSVARVCQVPDTILPARVNQHVAIIRPNGSKLVPEYLKYSLLNPKFKYYMLALASVGGTRNALTKAMIEGFELDIPSVPTQRRIADILSALDNKIELNRRTSDTLEAIAQAVFKEWFLNFRYPGAKGEMQDTESAVIPKGWRVGCIGDVSRLVNETVTPLLSPEAEFFHYSIPAFDNGRLPATERGATILSNKFRVKSNSILVSKLNPRIPRIWAVGEVDEQKSICSTEFQVLLPAKTFFRAFVANLFSQPHIIEIMKGRASGTSGSHQRIGPQDILDIEIVIPDDETLRRYEEVAGPYNQFALNAIDQCTALTQLRDTLLPKLMSGEIAA